MQTEGMTMHAQGIRPGHALPLARTELAGAICALLLGIFVVLMVGFAGASVLHESAHDTRHSLAFPCH